MSCSFKVLSAVKSHKLTRMLSVIGFEVYTCNSNMLDVVKKSCTIYPEFLIVGKELFLSMRKTGMIILLETLGVKIIVIPDNGDIDLDSRTYSMLSDLKPPTRKHEQKQ